MSFQSNYRKLEEFVILEFVVLTGFITTAVFKLSNFKTFPNLDEMLWHPRSRIFWDKILAWDFSGLIQSAQPGITVYWFTGFLMKYINFDFGFLGRLIKDYAARGQDWNAIVNTNDPAIYELYKTISFAFNFPLMSLTVIFYIFLYYLLKKLGFNMIVSLFSVLLVANNIFFVYWNTPSDKMLDIFLVLSFLTFLVYVTGKGGRKYFIFSSVLGAWAVLSKITALSIIPFYFLVSIVYAAPFNKNKLILIAKDYLIWGAVFTIVCIIFLPSIIFHPAEVYGLFHNSSVFESNYTAMGYVERLKDYAWIFFDVTLLYPPTWFALAAYIILFFKKKYKDKFAQLPLLNIRTMAIFISYFVIMVMVVSQNHDTRFMSPVFILVSVISASGVYVLAEIIKEKMKFSESIYISVFLIIIMSSLFSIFSSGLLFAEAIKKLVHK